MPANPGEIVGSFVHEFVAIISISWGKVNFVIQTKNLKGESSKSARKTAKVKQNRRLVIVRNYCVIVAGKPVT